MHKPNKFLAPILLIIILSIAVFGINKITQTKITKDITLDEIEECSTI